MFLTSLLAASFLLISSLTHAQQAGNRITTAYFPPLALSECTSGGESGANKCTSEKLSVNVDQNWRWLHRTDAFREPWTNCYKDDVWTECPGGKNSTNCAQNCALENIGQDTYQNSWGVVPNTTGDSLRMSGGRFYLMDKDQHSYRMFNVLNKEFTFTVDVSNMPCGKAGTMYFVEMAGDGGLGQGNNQAGARYGTGYCDAACAQDLKFVEGKANLEQNVGSCCGEFDIWESNKTSTAFTAHPCKGGRTTCNSDQTCGSGPKGDPDKYRFDPLSTCDKDGCDFNVYRQGDKEFFGFGDGFKVNTAKPFTVVTQFITDKSEEDLVEIRRFYVQDGKKIETPKAKDFQGFPDSMSDGMCAAQSTYFQNDQNDFKTKTKGGMKNMGAALKRGAVLVMSVWGDSSEASMQWLDGTVGTGGGLPGTERGPCVREPHNNPSAYIEFSDLKVGEIGSTTTAGGKEKPPSKQTLLQKLRAAKLAAAKAAAEFETAATDFIGIAANDASQALDL